MQEGVIGTIKRKALLNRERKKNPEVKINFYKLPCGVQIIKDQISKTSNLICNYNLF